MARYATRQPGAGRLLVGGAGLRGSATASPPVTMASRGPPPTAISVRSSSCSQSRLRTCARCWSGLKTTGLARDPGRQGIACGRCKEPAVSVKGEVIDLWCSRKAHCSRRQRPSRARCQRVPAGVSQARARLGARRHHRAPARPARPPPAAADLPTLADPGYEGSGIGIHIPVRQPAGGRDWISIPHSQRHPALAALPRGTRVRLAHRPLTCPPAHHCQPWQDRRPRPRRPRPDHFEHGCIT